MFYTPINVFNIKIKRSIDALYKGQLQKKKSKVFKSIMNEYLYPPPKSHYGKPIHPFCKYIHKEIFIIHKVFLVQQYY